MIENEDRKRFHDKTAAWTVFVLFIGILILTLPGIYPTERVVADYEKSQIESDSVMLHVRRMCRTAHPSGSDAHKEVFNYLIDKIKETGFEPEVQESYFSQDFGDRSTINHGYFIRNILVRVKTEETDSADAVLVAAHYDSVESGPGASDDGGAIGSMLELLRSIKADSGRVLKNDIIFLFSDAEEQGLYGAKAFIRFHPWAKDCKMVLNFEARGSSGFPLLYETFDNNSRTVSAFAQNAPHTFGTSAAAEVYKFMSNRTDFTVFKELGVEGMNFAFIDDYPHYHTRLDKPDNIDPLTLRALSQNMEALTLHFADADLNELKTDEDRVFFHESYGNMITYPASWALPLALIAAVLFLAVLISGLIKKTLHPLYTFLHLFLVPVMLVLGAGVVYALWNYVILPAHPQYDLTPHKALYNSEIYFFAFLLVSAGVVMLFYSLLHKLVSMLELFSAAVFWWTGLHIAAAVLVPGMSYFFAFPLFGGLIAYAYFVFLAKKDRFNFFDGIMAVVTAAPALYIILPFLYLVNLALTVHLAPVLAVLTGLMAVLLLPMLKIELEGFKHSIPLLLLTLSAGLIVWASLNSGFDEDHPQVNSVFYVRNLDNEKAFWMSRDKGTDEFTEQFLGESPKEMPLYEVIPTMTSASFISRAHSLTERDTILPKLAPRFEIVDFAYTSDSSAYRMQVLYRSRRKAEKMYLVLEEASSVRSVSLFDSLRVTENTEGNDKLNFYLGALPDSTIFSFEMADSTSFRAGLTEIKLGLSEVWDELFEKRPPQMMMKPKSSYNEEVFLHKSFEVNPKLFKREEDEVQK